jgi:hypothetical protein
MISGSSQPLVFVNRSANWLNVFRFGFAAFALSAGLTAMISKVGFHPFMLLFFFFVLLLFWLAQRGFYTETFVIGNGMISYTKKSLFSRRQRDEKLSDFIGVQAIMKQPTGNRRGSDFFAKYFVVLVHRDPGRSFMLSEYTQRGDGGINELQSIMKGDSLNKMRMQQEYFAKLLNVPAIDVDPDTGTRHSRAVADIDKTITELKKEEKLHVNTVPAYAGKKLQVKKENGWTSIVYDIRLLTMLATLFFWSLATLAYFQLSEKYYPIVLVTGMMGLITLVAGNRKQILTITNNAVDFRQESFIPFFRASASLSLSEIEEVKMSKDPMFNGAICVCITSKNEMINFGGGLKAPDREWVRAAVLSAIH